MLTEIYVCCTLWLGTGIFISCYVNYVGKKSVLLVAKLTGPVEDRIELKNL